MEDIQNAYQPGKMLRDVVMKDYFLTQEEVAKKTDLPLKRVVSLIEGKSDITVDVALKFEKAFKVPALYWLEMQAQYDLSCARRMNCYNLDNVEVIATHKDEIGETIRLSLIADKKLEDVTQVKRTPPKDKKKNKKTDETESESES